MICSKTKSSLFVAVTVLLLLSLAASPAFAAEAVTPDTRQVTLTEEEARLFEQFSQVKSWILEFSPRDATLQQLYEGAIKGMLDGLGDPYSQYLPPDQYRAFTSSLEGDYVGVGITIELVGGDITVVNTFDGSPARRAGMLPGDVITAVDGHDLRGKTSTEASALLRGEAGTSVLVTVKRPPKGTVLDIRITRELISPQALEVRDLSHGVAYIRIAQFTSRASREFEAVVGYLRLRGLRGLVLDLRDNPGGLLDSCIEIAEQLVPKGPIVELRRKDLKDQILSEEDPPIVPIAVLVNKGSASASEILAGAIRDRGVGILIGDNTFGKACVQTVASLGAMGGLRLTIADYYTPSGFSLAGTGLPPDVAAKPEEIVQPSRVVYKRPLGTGTIGLDVLAVQESLSFLGYEVGEADGIFGPATEAAVVRFIGDRNLEWDGSVDEPIVAAMNAAVAEAVRNRPDIVLETATALLNRKLASGAWQ